MELIIINDDINIIFDEENYKVLFAWFIVIKLKKIVSYLYPNLQRFLTFFQRPVLEKNSYAGFPDENMWEPLSAHSPAHRIF